MFCIIAWFWAVWIMGKPLSTLKLELTLIVSLGPRPPRGRKEQVMSKIGWNYCYGCKVSLIMKGLFKRNNKIYWKENNNDQFFDTLYIQAVATHIGNKHRFFFISYIVTPVTGLLCFSKLYPDNSDASEHSVGSTNRPSLAEAVLLTAMSLWQVFSVASWKSAK